MRVLHSCRDIDTSNLLEQNHRRFSCHYLISDRAFFPMTAASLSDCDGDAEDNVD